MTATCAIPPDVLTPSMRVRARLKILGWTIETLGAARAAREDRQFPYTEGTVRGWLKRMDLGVATKRTMDAIAKTVGVNSASFFTRDNPMHLVTSPTKDYTHRYGWLRSKEYILPAGMGWPKPKVKARQSDTMLTRIEVAMSVRGVSREQVAKKIGVGRTKFWRTWRRIKSWILRGFVCFGSRSFEHRKLNALIGKIAGALDLDINDLYPTKSGKEGWFKILDPRVSRFRGEEPYVWTSRQPGSVFMREPAAPHPGDALYDMMMERIKALDLDYPTWIRFLDAVQHYNLSRTKVDIRREIREQYENPLFLKQLAEALFLDGPDDLEDSERGRKLRSKPASRAKLELYAHRFKEFDRLCAHKYGRRVYSDEHDITYHGSAAQIEEWCSKAQAFLDPGWVDHWTGFSLSMVDARERWNGWQADIQANERWYRRELRRERSLGLIKRPLWPILDADHSFPESIVSA